MSEHRILPEKAYRELTGANPSQDQLSRWNKLQRVLEIHRGDALWSVIIAFDFYGTWFSQSAKSILLWAKILAALILVQILLIIFLALR